MGVSISDKYTYMSTITDLPTSRTHLQIKDGVIYVACNYVDADGYTRVGVFHSTDDGATWSMTTVPGDDVFLDPKLVLVNYDWWIFAHTTNYDGIDTVHLIRRVVDDDNNATWDEDWQLVLDDQTLTARVTDAVVDPDNPTVVHVAYDARTARGRYTVHLATLSTIAEDDSLVVNDVQVASTPAYDQHNARLALISSSTLAVVYEQRQTAGNWGVAYAQYVWATQQLTTMQLSGDVVVDKVHVDSYHPSLTVDNTGAVHVSWLQTSTGYVSAKVMYTLVVDNMRAPVEMVSTEAADDRYPWIIANDGDLYVLLNLDHASVRYTTRKAGESEWTEITNLAGNTWVLLNGWCADANLYTVIATEHDELAFLRVDTKLAETFAPVDDLEIAKIDKNDVTLTWTKARNAEAVVLQGLGVDHWETAPTLTPPAVDDVQVHVTALPADGFYRFRLIRVHDDNSRDIVNLMNDTWIKGADNGDLLVDMPVNVGITEVRLEYTVLTWKDIKTMNPHDDEVTVPMTSMHPWFRLRVTGGPRAGYSNEVSPLTATAEANGDVTLRWATGAVMAKQEVLQSGDGLRWFPASVAAVVKPEDTSAVITGLANAVCYYQVVWTTVDDRMLVSNIVTVVNNLHVVSYGGTWAVMGWTDVSSGEPRRMQVSADGGANWKTVVNAINNQTMRVPGLERVTEYRLRLEYPNRFTGKYSNIVTLTTDTEPVDDWTLVSLDGVNAVLTATVDDYTSAEVVYRDLNDDSFALVTVPVTAVRDENNVLTVELPDLPLGMYVGAALKITGGKMAGTSAEVVIAVDGTGPENVALTPVDAHTLRLTADAPPGATADNLTDVVVVVYSMNGIDWYEQRGGQLDSGQLVVDIPNLLQSTEYTAQLVITRGVHKGASALLAATTADDVFPAIYGDRLPGERSAVVVDDKVYIADRDKIYTVDLENRDQQVLVANLQAQSARVWTTLVVIGGQLRVVMASGTTVFYGAIDEPLTTMYTNPQANVMTRVQALARVDGVLVVTWVEMLGYTARLHRAVIDRDGNIALDVLTTADAAVAATACALTHDGMWSVMIANGSMSMLRLETVLDPAAADFGDETVTMPTVDVTDASVYDALLDPRLAVDNLGDVYAAYALSSGGCAAGYVVDNEYQPLGEWADVDWVTPLLVDNKRTLAYLGVRDQHVVACRWSAAAQVFTDWAQASELTLDGTVLTLAKTGDDYLAICAKYGRWQVISVDVNATVAAEVVNGVRVNDRMVLDVANAHVETWTTGDPEDKPHVFVKINQIIRDVTDRLVTGDQAHTKVRLTALNEATNTPLNSMGVVTITAMVDDEEQTVNIDITSWLTRTWQDTETVVNKLG